MTFIRAILAVAAASRRQHDPRAASCRGSASYPPGLDADVRSDEAAAVAEVAGGFCRFGVQRLDDVFDYKAAAAEVAEDLFPAVQIIQRPLLAVRAADDVRQRAGAII